MSLKRARTIIPLAIALAAWGVFVWTCYGDRVADGDDVIAGVLAVVASGWALLDYYHRRSSRERAALRAGEHQREVAAMAEGVAAYIEQQVPQEAAAEGRELARLHLPFDAAVPLGVAARVHQRARDVLDAVRAEALERPSASARSWPACAAASVG